MNIPLSGPKKISTSHFLSKAIVAEAKNFAPGGSRNPLVVDKKQQFAGVGQFTLNAKQKIKLGRANNLVESVVAGITDRSSVFRLTSHLAKLGVPEKTLNTTQFFFVTVRRRVPGNLKHALVVSKKHKVADTQSFVFGVTLTKTKAQPIISVLFNRKKGAITLENGKIVQALNSEDTGNTPDTVTSYPDDPTQDFAKCYSECLNNVPPWLLTVVSGICASCLTAVGVAIASEGIAVPILILICVACVAMIGLVIGNCILTCHEMLGA
jgi:hypothetical protein